MNYKLTKTQKGKKFLYTVTDENGTVISDRLSTRDYVACTANGAFYFGRLDLIGKGDHGRSIAYETKFCADPRTHYTYTLRNGVHRPFIESEYLAWVGSAVAGSNARLSELNKIAYL